MGAAASKPLLAHSSRQQANGYSENTNKTSWIKRVGVIMDLVIDECFIRCQRLYALLAG